jgi:hypothetical protein
MKAGELSIARGQNLADFVGDAQDLVPKEPAQVRRAISR